MVLLFGHVSDTLTNLLSQGFVLIRVTPAQRGCKPTILEPPDDLATA
jgi:hypothetical protein